MLDIEDALMVAFIEGEESMLSPLLTSPESPVFQVPCFPFPLGTIA